MSTHQIIFTLSVVLLSGILTHWRICKDYRKRLDVLQGFLTNVINANIEKDSKLLDNYHTIFKLREDVVRLEREISKMAGHYPNT